MVSVTTESISTQTAAAETQAASTQTEMTTSTSTSTCTASDSCGLQKSVSEPLVTSKSMTDKVQDLSEDVKRTLSDAQKRAQSKYEEAKDKVKGKVDEVKTKVDEVKTAADSKYEEVNSKVAEKYEEVKQRYEETKQVVTEKVSQAQESVQSKVEGAKTSAVTKYDEAKETAVSKYEETKQSLQSKVAKVRKSLAEVQEKVQAKFSCHDDEDSASSRASEDGNEEDTSEGTGATSPAGSTTPTTPKSSSSCTKAESARKCVKRFSNKVRASLSGKLAEVKETVKETDVDAVQEKVKILAEKQKARVFKSWQELSTACKKRSSGNCCQHAGDAVEDAVEVDSTTSTGTTTTSSASKIPASFVGGLLSSLPGRLSGISWDETNITPNSLEGKVVIMTGGNNGLGYEATKMLCVIGGAHVVIASRSMERVNDAVAKIEEELKSSDSKNNTSKGSVEGMQLDLASLKSVRKFASDFKAKHSKLHILVHNAGIMFFPENDTKTRTEDGLERYTQINHLGAFLLTKLLLEPLKKAGLEEAVDGKVLEPARVVTVASGANWDAARRGVNFDPAAWTTSSTCSSKAANCPCDPCECKPVCECGTEVESPASDATVDPFPGGSMVSAFDTAEDDKVAEEVEQKNVAGVDQKTRSSESEHQERKAKEYNRYGESKLMSILFMKSLAEKFAAADLPIVSCGMHPGGSSTSLFDNTQSKFWQAFNALSMDSKKGCLGIVRCVVDTETVGNGDYVGPSMGMVGYPTICTNSWVHLSPMARNKEQRDELWAKSEEALGEKFEVM